VFAAAVLASLAMGGVPAQWDGVNPFRCELQQAGKGATVPHPEADPYCVEFDKTHQNVTEGGVAEFLAQEPARVGAASPKCFYFQSDHWTGSVVQDDGTTETYHWDGHYFFDKATGDGGGWVTNVRSGGQHAPIDTFGGITRNQVDADPACVAKAKEHPEIYATNAAKPHGCIATQGGITRKQLGPIRLGMRDGDVRAKLGAPAAVRRGFLRYCADGGGGYLVGQRNDRSGDLGTDPKARTVIVLSTSPSLRARARGRRVLRGRRWVAVSRLRGKRLRDALRRAGVRR
jgi:hypothetical protein